MLNQIEFYCRDCKQHFKTHQVRILKRADGVYYTAYCPNCNEVAYRRKR